MHQQETWQKVKKIFGDVLDQPENLRADFLKTACGDDAELLEEVESLLEANRETKPILEENKFSLSTLLDSNEKKYEGKIFGHYKIIREIGRGGMGAVFLAERDDGEFIQQTALKIVRQTIVDSESARRFKRERQILASLNHPNIAKLLDGGVSEEGEPFLVMEYVEGSPLLDFAESQNLTIEARLDLFVKICSAVSYAHRSLVIHRDIKPSNILVTKDGEPKLLDFGLAKILETGVFGQDSTETETQFRAFTLAYASPEQIRGGHVTTATDVYSLSVVLYELLTGIRPFHFEKKTLEEILNSVGNTEPQKPSEAVTKENIVTTTNHKSQITNPKLLAGDLDNICLMGLRKEPERRYQSVGHLAEDIKRHLKGLPILARPQTFSYQASKFIGRNKVAVFALFLVILSLVGGIAVSLWQAKIARQERDRAERRFNEVRQLSNSLLFEITPKVENLNGSTETREILLKRALEYLDSLAQESQNDWQLQSELASAYEKIGDLQGNPSNPNLIDFEAAIRNYEKANQMRLRFIENNPQDLESQRKTAENYRVLGNIYSQTNDIEKSTKNTKEALKIYENLVAQNPSSDELLFSLAKVNYDLGLNLQSNKKLAESIQYFEKSKNILAVINAQKPNQLEILRTIAEVKIQNANALSWEEKQQKAEIEAKEAIKDYEKLYSENPNDMAVRGGMWLIYWLTSNIYQDQNDQLAYEYAQKALQVVQETVARDKANIRAKQQLAKSYSTLGETATTLGKSAEAIGYLEKACQMLREIVEITAKNNRLKSELALSLRRLGSAQTKQGLLDKSLDTLRESEEMYNRILQIIPDDRRSNRNLADVYEQFGITFGELFNQNKTENYRQAAETNYQKALEILMRLDANNSLAEADRKFLDRIKLAVEKYAQINK